MKDVVGLEFVSFPKVESSQDSPQDLSTNHGNQESPSRTEASEWPRTALVVTMWHQESPGLNEGTSLASFLNACNPFPSF